MKALLIVLLPVLIAVSGCIIPGLPSLGGSAGSGLAILAFEPAFPRVYSDEPVEFRLRVQNTGSVDARDVTPKIIGLETWDREADTCNRWDKISAAVPSIGAPGETANCKWTFVAPDVPRGLSTTYSPTVRLYYSYSTSVVKSIFLASSKELRLMKDRGDAPPAQTTSQTSGPVQINVKTDTPVRVWGDSVTFPITITINNAGGGVICPSVSDCESNQNLNKLRIEVRSDSDIVISDCDTGDVELWQGKTNTLICQATFSGLRDIGLTQSLITVKANYGYYTDRTTQVTVTKR